MMTIFYDKIKVILSSLLPLVFILLNCGYANGQSIQQLEQQLYTAQSEYNTANKKLDSLNVYLSKRADLIDKTKKDPNSDEDLILNLMANSVSISNQIKVQEGLLKKLSGEIESYKSKLNIRYTSKLDSLKAILISGIDDENINSSILYYTEKRLLVSPRISSLSFNPQKLLLIDIESKSNILEKKILDEYFKNALDEVESYLALVENENDEVNDIFLLQKKAQTFLEDAELDRSNRPIGVVSREIHASSTDEALPGGDAPFYDRNSETTVIMMPQLESYSKIMSQLSFINPAGKGNWQTALEAAKENLSLPNYKQFLDQLAKRLGEYKLILSNKIKKLNENSP